MGTVKNRAILAGEFAAREPERAGELLIELVFALESAAHLRGLERQLMPIIDRVLAEIGT